MKLHNRGRCSAPPSMRHLPRWQQLVTASWLAALLSGKAVAAVPTGAWRLFEVGYDTLESFRASHIAGAGYLDTRQLEQGPLWNKIPDRALLRLLLEHGIRRDTCVILYGRNNLAAARAAHLLLYAGVTDVRLLDGGFAAWNEGVFPAAAGAPAQFAAAQDFGAAFPAHPEYLIDTRQVKALLRRGEGALVSIRTWKEFIGQTSGYAYIRAKGDIPGACWGRAGDDGDVNSMSDFHRPDGTMKAPDEICGFWNKAGIHAGQQTTFYCGTGWRASLAFFYAWLMDWQRISVYDGGWCEWSSDPANPIVSRSPLLADAV